LKKKEQQITNSSTLPLPGDKEKKDKILLFNIFMALDTNLSIYNQQMKNV